MFNGLKALLLSVMIFNIFWLWMEEAVSPIPSWMNLRKRWMKHRFWPLFCLISRFTFLLISAWIGFVALIILINRFPLIHYYYFGFWIIWLMITEAFMRRVFYFLYQRKEHKS